MNRKNYLLLLFILLKFALQYFAINSGYELHRDEFLHLDLGKHLAWGYFSVPPITAVISSVIILLGNSVFWVKFFPALFGALIVVVVWKTVEELNGGWFALVLASVANIFSVLIRINILYQPNSLDFLVWTTLFFILVKYIKTEKPKWLYYAGVIFAVGFLNKYNVVFLLAGLAPAMLITPYRKIFTNRHFYLSALIALMLISPNLFWQYNNDFPVIRHLKLLAETQLINVNRFDFLLEQLYFFTGSLPVIFAAFISFFTYEPFKKYRLFFFTFIFTIALFVYLHAKNYYSIGLYPLFLAFGAVYLEVLLKKGWLRFLKIIMVAGPVISFIPLFPIILPVLSPTRIMEKKDVFDKFNLTRWEDGKLHDLPQDFADMLGWRELASLVDSAFTLIDDKSHTIIHCDNYGEAGAINYYSKQKYSEAYSMNADYINWYPLDKFEIKNVILVKEADDNDKERVREKDFFESVMKIGEIKNEFAREKGTSVYLLIGAKTSVNKVLHQEIINRMNRE